MNNEEIQEKFEQLASAIDWIKTKLVDLQEEKGLAPVKTPYEVEVPTDIEEYYILEEGGDVLKANAYSEKWRRKAFIRGLVFETREEAEQFKKEQILLFKLHKWAEEHNGGWKPDWNDLDEGKWAVRYEGDIFYKYLVYSYQYFLKLPYFKSEEIARKFIEEFGDEIKEVFC